MLCNRHVSKTDAQEKQTTLALDLLPNYDMDFQTSFLKRPGVLGSIDGFWQLRVEGKPYDMLLDKLPWAISIINQPWLAKPVHVEWQ